MPSLAAYNGIVAARTRAAEQILGAKDLLALYEEQGGLKDDLKKIKQHGERAEALSHARSDVHADKGGTTAAVKTAFDAVEKEYGAVMSVLHAVRHDLDEEGAGEAALKRIDKILSNEGALSVKTVKDEGGKKQRTATRSQAEEARRAEIQKDAEALLKWKAIQPALAKRKVTTARLTKLRDGAKALVGRIAEKSLKKGAGKAATQAVREAVAAQKKIWNACYRILAAVARVDNRVKQLVAEAATRRK